jgi:hypothetical protein
LSDASPVCRKARPRAPPASSTERQPVQLSGRTIGIQAPSEDAAVWEPHRQNTRLLAICRLSIVALVIVGEHCLWAVVGQAGNGGAIDCSRIVTSQDR